MNSADLVRAPISSISRQACESGRAGLLARKGGRFSSGARRTDPATSHAAAARAVDFADTQAGRIHMALIAGGPMTAAEIGTATGLTVVQVDRRLPDLKRAGLAEVVTTGGVAAQRDGYRVWRVA